MTAAGGQSEATDLLVHRLLDGDRQALARAITLVENCLDGAPEILSSLSHHAGHAATIGVTGPPGAGKSTLIAALIAELRQRQRTVSVLAVDPSSPHSGGALLGDRVRMNSHSCDPGVFVRSIAARGHLGGLFQTARGVVQLLDAAGPDFIIIETVGTGQSEIEIADLAQLNLVVCVPGLGDEVQALKAGILEIADILVVNKSDHAQAAITVQQLQDMLHWRSPQHKPAIVLATVATSGQGVAALADQLEAFQAEAPNRLTPPARSQQRQLSAITESAVAQLRQRIVAAAPLVEELCARVQSGQLGVDAAAGELLHQLGHHHPRTHKQNNS